MEPRCGIQARCHHHGAHGAHHKLRQDVGVTSTGSRSQNDQNQPLGPSGPRANANFVLLIYLENIFSILFFLEREIDKSGRGVEVRER